MSDTIVIDGEVELLNVIDGDPDVFIGGGGSQPTGTKSILLTEAGTKTEDVSSYASAEINAVTDATASGAVASFSDGAEDVPMDSCVADIEPVQSGSGDPSPSNVRPISGWSEVNVYVSPTLSAQDATVHTVSLGQTVYGGTLDVVTGVLTVDRVMHQLTGSESFTLSGAISANPRRFMKMLSAMNWEPSADNVSGISDRLVYKRTASVTDAFGTFRIGSYLTIPDSESVFATANDFNAYLLAQYNNGTPVEICYPLATPQTIQLSPTEVKTLLGSNSVWADSGDIAVGYKADVYLTEGGVTPTGTKSITITSNGTTTEDVTDYAGAEINVNVPASAVDTGTKNINSNGTHDVVGYANASVNVPNSYSQSDEGKVVSDGALVSQTSDTVTANDTYDTTLINSLTVNVSGGGSGLVTVASGTFTGAGTNPSNAGMGINVGKKMPKTDFMFKIVARAESVYTYDTNYKYAWGIAVIDSDIASFNLSSAGTSKQPVSAVQYDVDNSGTVTSVSAGSHVVDVCTIRNTGASYTRANNIRIDQYSDRFEIRLFNSTPGFQYATGIVYDWEIVYFGSNPSQDIVDLS